MPIQIYEGSNWIDIPEERGKIKFWEGSNWSEPIKVRYWTGTQWNTVWEVPTAPPPSGGTVLLNATSSSIGSSTTAWALFNTAAYQGRITAVRALVAWKTGTSYTWTLAARASGGSISRSKLPEYQNRSIYHNVASGSIASYNSGAATGFTLTKPAGVGWSTEIGSVRMEVTYS